MFTHRLLIDVHAVLSVLHKVSLLDKMLQVGPTLCIYFISVRIGFGVECNLGLVDVEEAHGVAGGHRASLLGIEGVVSWRYDLGAALLIGEVAAERTNFDHLCCFESFIVIMIAFEIRFLIVFVLNFDLIILRANPDKIKTECLNSH